MSLFPYWFHTIHLKVMMSKQMNNNCPKEYICQFIDFMFYKYFHLNYAEPKWLENATLM